MSEFIGRDARAVSIALIVVASKDVPKPSVSFRVKRYIASKVILTNKA